MDENGRPNASAQSPEALAGAGAPGTDLTTEAATDVTTDVAADAIALREWVVRSPLLLPFPASRIPSGLGDSGTISDSAFVAHYRPLREKQTRLWRLGLLFEDAVHALLLASPEVDSVARGTHVLPTGELDFLVTFRGRPDELLHIETAVKFYFCRDGDGSRDLDRFVGPERRDTLGKKIRKLEREQLRRLVDFPQNRGLIPIEPGVRIESVPFVKGMLFYPWDARDPEARARAIPDAVSPGHARGLYLARREWADYLETLNQPHYREGRPEGRAPPAKEILRLEKADWVHARILSRRTFTPDDLPAPGAAPVAFAVMDGALPIVRGFVVPDDWHEDPKEESV